MIDRRVFKPWDFLPSLVLLPIIIFVVYTILFRIFSPIELEWNEGHSYEMAFRALKEQPLYPHPENGWVPYIYPPLYHYLLALTLWITKSEALFWGRLLSVLGLVLANISIYHIVKKFTLQTAPAVLAAAFYTAHYKATGYWYDVARVDSLANGLFAAGLVFCLNRQFRQTQFLLGAVLLTAAVFTKTTYLPAVLFILTYHLYKRPMQSFAVAIVIVFLTVNIVMIYEKISNTEFLKYTLGNAAKHPRDYSALIGFPPRIFTELGVYIILPLCLTVLWLLKAPRNTPLPRGSFLMAICGILFVGSISSYLLFGGYVNNFMPVFLASSILLGITWPGLVRLLRPALRPFVGPVLAVLVALHCYHPWGLAFDPHRHIPPKEAKEALAALNQWLATEHAVGNAVLIAHHQYYGVRAGHPLWYNVDMVRCAGWAGDQVPLTMLADLASGKFRHIVLDRDPLSDEWLSESVRFTISERYRFAGFVPGLEDHALAETLLPVTGAPMAPRYLYTLRD